MKMKFNKDKNLNDDMINLIKKLANLLSEIKKLNLSFDNIESNDASISEKNSNKNKNSANVMKFEIYLN